MGAFARLEINPAVMFDEMIYVVTYGLFMVYLCTYIYIHIIYIYTYYIYIYIFICIIYIYMSYVYIIYGLKVFNRTYPTL